jgi:hypothetical protein
MTPRLYLELAALAVLAAGFFWYRHTLILDGEQKIETVDARAVAVQKLAIAKQEAADAQILEEAQNAHQHELQAIAADQSAHPLGPVRLCNEPSHPRAVPATPAISSHPDTPAGILPRDDAVHPDLAVALGLLVDRADQLAADARELAAVAHP